MSNNISMIANLVADAEIKQVGQNDVLEFRLANNVGFGEKKTTNWFNGAIWGTRGKSLVNHLKKGKKVFVTGQLVIREYTNKEGVKAYSNDIRVSELDFADSAPGAGGASTPASNGPAAGTQADDTMPF